MTELYFLTWDEIEEGQEVWAFDGSDNKRCWPSSRVTKKGELILLDGERDDIANTTNFRKLKFLPVPQDRPEPQIWDEYLRQGGTREKFDVQLPYLASSRTFCRNWIIENDKIFRALAAWINHVLEKNNG